MTEESQEGGEQGGIAAHREGDGLDVLGVAAAELRPDANVAAAGHQRQAEEDADPVRHAGGWRGCGGRSHQNKLVHSI